MNHRDFVALFVAAERDGRDKKIDIIGNMIDALIGSVRSLFLQLQSADFVVGLSLLHTCAQCVCCAALCVLFFGC